MAANKVTVVDYGSGNVFSVSKALEHVGASVDVTRDVEKVANAERLFLPGVGAFRAALELLQNSGLSESIQRFTETGRPFLGVCVGMQLMMDGSEEFGWHPGFGLIEGRVSPIATTTAGGDPHPVPHIGWSPLIEPKISWAGSLLDGLGEEDSVYFVHSYAAVPINPTDVLATCDYNGRVIVAGIARDNLTGLQFHPEKSGDVGLRILKTFIEIR